jgi:hypothetical protein
MRPPIRTSYAENSQLTVAAGDYEGPEALELVTDDSNKLTELVTAKEESEEEARPEEALSASEDEVSEDEYIEDKPKSEGKAKVRFCRVFKSTGPTLSTWIA